MVHEFAHFRYGVFEEYGYPDEREDHEDLFPYAYTSPFGYQEVNSCNNTKIEGKISTLYDYIYSEFYQFYFDFINIILRLLRSGANCEIPDTSDCRFRPDMNAATGPTSSLMSMHFIPTVNKYYLILKMFNQMQFFRDKGEQLLRFNESRPSSS